MKTLTWLVILLSGGCADLEARATHILNGEEEYMEKIVLKERPKIGWGPLQGSAQLC